jgi:hypothetical protein
MSRPPTEIEVVVPASPPPLTAEAVRVLAAIVRDAARETPVVELRIGHSPDEPEAVAS